MENSFNVNIFSFLFSIFEKMIKFLDIFKKTKKEYILCSAVWYKELELKFNFSSNVLPVNCDKGLVFCGFRHVHCIRTMSSITGKRSVTAEVGHYVQGFLTSENRFVDRKEGLQIAKNSKQIIHKNFLNQLFSEDLW
jgi:hypothetical protein